MTIRSDFYIKNKGKDCRIYGAGMTCHQITTSTAFEKIIISPRGKVINNRINKNYELLQKICKKFRDINYIIYLHKDFKINDGTTLEHAIELRPSETRELSNIEELGFGNNNNYMLRMYEIFRSILKYPKILKNIGTYIEKFDKMNIYDIYYIAHQLFVKNGIGISKWNNYYDPSPCKFIEYVPLENILKYHNSQKSGYRTIQHTSKVINDISFDINTIGNRPLKHQIKYKERIEGWAVLKGELSNKDAQKLRSKGIIVSPYRRLEVTGETNKYFKIKQRWSIEANVKKDLFEEKLTNLIKY